MHVIVTFLAVLEMMKMGKITVYQDGIFEEILIESKEVHTEVVENVSIK